MSIPVDAKLYDKIKKKIYLKYPTHSAYRSGMLVKTYKKEFSKIYGDRKSPYTPSIKKTGGLTRWFKEKWISDTGKVGATTSTTAIVSARVIGTASAAAVAAAAAAVIASAAAAVAASGGATRTGANERLPQRRRSRLALRMRLAQRMR